MLVEQLNDLISRTTDINEQQALSRVIVNLTNPIVSQLNWARKLHWCRLCKERKAVTDESQIKIAEEVQSWTAHLDGVAASYGARVMLFGNDK